MYETSLVHIHIFFACAYVSLLSHIDGLDEWEGVHACVLCMYAVSLVQNPIFCACANVILLSHKENFDS